MDLAIMFGRRRTAKPPAASNASVARVVETARLRARVAELEARQARRELAVAQARDRIRERLAPLSGLPPHRQGRALAEALAAGLAEDLAVVARHGMSGVGARPKPLGRGAA